MKRPPSRRRRTDGCDPVDHRRRDWGWLSGHVRIVGRLTPSPTLGRALLALLDERKQSGKEARHG